VLAAYGIVVDTVAASTHVNMLPDIKKLLQAVALDLDWKTFLISAPSDIEKVNVGIQMHDILCLQQGEEERWRELVMSMSTICRRDILSGNGPGSQGAVELVISQAMELLRLEVHRLVGNADELGFGTCPKETVQIPDNIETLLSKLVEDTEGLG
jgi:hypothetical protein